MIDYDITIEFTIFVEHNYWQSVVRIFGCLQDNSTAIELVDFLFIIGKRGTSIRCPSFIWLNSSARPLNHLDLVCHDVISNPFRSVSSSVLPVTKPPKDVYERTFLQLVKVLDIPSFPRCDIMPSGFNDGTFPGWRPSVP